MVGFQIKITLAVFSKYQDNVVVNTVKQNQYYNNNNVSPFSPLETISTSLWASLYHHLPVRSVFSHVNCQ